MGAKCSDHIVDGETNRFGVGEHARDEGTQPTIVLTGWVSLCRRGADERPHSALGFDDAGTLEFRVDARDGVGVDAEVDRQLADGRELIADLKTAATESIREALAPFARGQEVRLPASIWIVTALGS